MRAIHGAGEVAKTLRSICGHSRTYFNADALRHSEFAQRAFALRCIHEFGPACEQVDVSTELRVAMHAAVGFPRGPSKYAVICIMHA